MLAKDIMTTEVVTVHSNTRVEDIVTLLLERNISAVPVVDANLHVIGIVSEGDLIRRSEDESKRGRSWWLYLLTSPEDRAREYIKIHGHVAGDIMTRNVISVFENTSVGEIAELLEKHRIKRVPVVRNGELVGIVSRSNLLQGLAARKDQVIGKLPPDDQKIREQINAVVAEEDWIVHGLNAIVTNGVVELWGQVDSANERRALRIAVEEIPGVKKIEDHLVLLPPYLQST